MEEDDEFGDLYTDVFKPPSSPLPVDLSRHIEENDTICGYTSSISHPPFKPYALMSSAPHEHKGAAESIVIDSVVNSYDKTRRENPWMDKDDDGVGVALPSHNRILELDYSDNTGHDVLKIVDRGDADREETNGVSMEDREQSVVPMPRLSICLVPDSTEKKDLDNADGGEDEWESDSDDGLQIVLNENIHESMAMDRSIRLSDDEEGDHPSLVIVAGPNQSLQPEQEWVEDASQSFDGEKKDNGDAVKVNGGTSLSSSLPKVGYSAHPYNPYHSQFKYVRPVTGSTPVTSVPAGASIQLSRPPPPPPPPARGRGEWRPPKSFHSGFGLPWTNGVPTRGFGLGLEFTLPSHKNIFEVDIDGFEEKPWKLPGVDVSDFFNFNLNEETWKDYCRILEQLRLEATMQSKIRVYESGRTEKEYDPDLPPELAAAVGMHDPTAANDSKLGISAVLETRDAPRVRPPLPTGRAIQVEGGYCERLPSVDTRPPRLRDSDAVIEIILQDTTCDENDGDTECFTSETDPPVVLPCSDASLKEREPKDAVLPLPPPDRRSDEVERARPKWKPTDSGRNPSADPAPTKKPTPPPPPPPSDYSEESKATIARAQPGNCKYREGSNDESTVKQDRHSTPSRRNRPQRHDDRERRPTRATDARSTDNTSRRRDESRVHAEGKRRRDDDRDRLRPPQLPGRVARTDNPTRHHHHHHHHHHPDRDRNGDGERERQTLPPPPPPPPPSSSAHGRSDESRRMVRSHHERRHHNKEGPDGKTTPVDPKAKATTAIPATTITTATTATTTTTPITTTTPMTTTTATTTTGTAGGGSSSGDDQRGRSKLERWASRNERSSSGGAEADVDGVRQDEDQEKHSDTVEKLKKRSERFKASLGHKESPVAVVVKTENELLPPPPPMDPSVKPERPTRKRRWIST